jgi:hypoxanthine phosphoribosyltransferase
MLCSIADSVDKSGCKYNMIAGVTRGGLVPAVILSHWLDIPMLAMTKHDKFDNHGDGVLVIDEIYDTGDTTKQIRIQNPNVHVAVLVSKDNDAFVEHIGTIQHKNPDWITFPWEVR